MGYRLPVVAVPYGLGHDKHHEQASQPQETLANKPAIPYAKKPSTPSSYLMFPHLHSSIRAAIPTPQIPDLWLNSDPDDDDANLEDEYDTRIMAKFTCRNQTCLRGSWPQREDCNLNKGVILGVGSRGVIMLWCLTRGVRGVMRLQRW